MESQKRQRDPLEENPSTCSGKTLTSFTLYTHKPVCLCLPRHSIYECINLLIVEKSEIQQLELWLYTQIIYDTVSLTIRLHNFFQNLKIC